ncbi:hypothetical protein XarzCFBP7410_05430 [Xanthomonas arboricola pv. zantedeschiae]|nr:hypothetical protein XarzCFBP7410_05430 [Xanthomonas arboricola pv. zantedeschiae]
MNVEINDSEASMSRKRYTDKFEVEAVQQVTDRGFKVAEVAQLSGFTTHSLYAGYSSLASVPVPCRVRTALRATGGRECLLNQVRINSRSHLR